MAGNGNPDFQQVKTVENWNNVKGAPKIEKVEAVETRKVVVKFDKNLQELATGSFKIMKGTEDLTKDATYNWDNAKTLEIYLADDKALPTGQLDAYKLVYTKTTGTYDVYGRYLEIVAGEDVNSNGSITTGGNQAKTEKGLADKMAPAVAAFKYISGNANTSATGAAFNEEGKTGNENLDGKPIVMVTNNAPTLTPTAVAGENDVKIEQTVTVLYTEEIEGTSLSVTTYTFNNDFSVAAVPTATGRKVTITIKREFKSKKSEADIKAEMMDWLNDLTVTQVNSVKDKANNVMSGNSNALDILDVK